MEFFIDFDLKGKIKIENFHFLNIESLLQEQALKGYLYIALIICLHMISQTGRPIFA